MSFQLRLVCIVGAVITFIVITSRIRRRKMQIDDSLFWVILSFALLVLAFFPQLATGLASILGFQAPSNLVFVVVIAILLVKLFSLSTEVSSLRHKLTELAQEDALRNMDERKDEQD